jgi:ribosomal protein L21
MAGSKVGAPTLAGASVMGEIVAPDTDRQDRRFKKKRRKERTGSAATGST